MKHTPGKRGERERTVSFRAALTHRMPFSLEYGLDATFAEYRARQEREKGIRRDFQPSNVNLRAHRLGNRRKCGRF